VEQEGDEDGVIRGTYTYLDPNWTWQTVRKCPRLKSPDLKIEVDQAFYLIRT
jgi:hypothetical protein